MTAVTMSTTRRGRDAGRRDGDCLYKAISRRIESIFKEIAAPWRHTRVSLQLPSSLFKHVEKPR
jgi:hypothetical protein